MEGVIKVLANQGLGTGTPKTTFSAAGLHSDMTREPLMAAVSLKLNAFLKLVHNV